MSPGRNGFDPQVALTYDSGNGNGPFGMRVEEARHARGTSRAARRLEPGLLVIWALTGCHAGAGGPPPRAGAMPPGGPPAAIFEQRGIAVHVESPQWDAGCGRGAQPCRAVLAVTVENRSADGPASLADIELVENVRSPFAFVTPFKAPVEALPKGRPVRRALRDVRDTEHEVLLRVAVHLAGEDLVLSSPPFVLENEARAAVKSTCKASGGKWGENARGAPYCAKRSRDAGNGCHDGRDCEWLCLFDRFEAGRPVGHCSEFIGESGCFSYIEKGASERPPSDVKAPPPQRCSD